MTRRSPFPKVFWIANSVEILERFAYYGIYLGFGIYMEHLGFSKGQLGIVQSVFLAFSYIIPVLSGTFADRFGFKKMLIVSYLAYLPSVLLLMLTKSFSGIALTMLSIGLAAGIFKPLISGTVRAVTDQTNKTLGFGIFYAMVNIGASFGPVIMGRLRAVSWNNAFLAGAASIGLMLLITIFFYKEPPREMEGLTLKKKFRDLAIALSDLKFAVFLVLLGLFFWLPFWAFFNLAAVYVNENVDTARLYTIIRAMFGRPVADFLSRADDDGTRRLLGEAISHSGYIIMILQVFVSRIAERFKAIPTFSAGLLVMAAGYLFLGFAVVFHPALVFLGILLFAIGEMASSPRIQEYITWLAPKEKAGLYMGTNFLSIGIGGALSGVIFTTLYGCFLDRQHPETIWYMLAACLILGTVIINLYTRKAGHFEEVEK
ncbi:MFS transporter [bacterium]|nr:MFS transporter [bacterium]